MNNYYEYSLYIHSYYGVGEGEGVCGGYVANSANIMRIDSTPCNLLVTSCYSL